MKILFGLIILIAAIIFIASFAVWLFIVIPVFIGIFLLAWICGVPVTITMNGDKRVYRWTKRIR